MTPTTNLSRVLLALGKAVVVDACIRLHRDRQLDLAPARSSRYREASSLLR